MQLGGACWPVRQRRPPSATLECSYWLPGLRVRSPRCAPWSTGHSLLRVLSRARPINGSDISRASNTTRSWHMPEIQELIQLKDMWDEQEARSLGTNQLTLLRYRSNLLGADLRITNFGGGNTSSKFDMTDPFTGEPTRVMAVKGSGGDIGSIKETGFALLYMDRLNQLKKIYRGEAFEDEMVSFYPLSAFGQNKVATSIDTPLHAFLPFPHVD